MRRDEDGPVERCADLGVDIGVDECTAGESCEVDDWSGESGVETWTNLLGRLIDSRLEDDAGLAREGSRGISLEEAISARLEVVLDRPMMEAGRR